MSPYVASLFSRFRSWLAFAAIALLTTSALAWESNPALNDLFLQSADDELQSPHAYAHPSGGAAIVAIDVDSFFNESYLTFNRIDADGNLLFGQYGTRFATLPENADNELVLLEDGAGGAFCLVKAQPNAEPNARYRIYRVDGSGTLLSAPGGVLLTTNTDAQYAAKMIGDDQDGVIVVFELFTGGQYDIVAQRLDGALNIDWIPGGITVCGASGDQRGPQLVSDGSSGAIFAWTDYRNVTTDVFGSRRLAGGSLIGPVDGVAVAAGGADESGPRMTTNGLGGAFVAYATDENESTGDVAFASVASSMSVDFRTDVTIGDGLVQSPIDVISDGAGGAFVAWRDGTAQFDPVMFVQYLTPQGTPRWIASGRTVTSTPSIQLSGLLKLDGTGGVLAVWREGRNGFSDVYAQRFDSAGIRRWNDSGVPVSIAADFQSDISVVDADDGAHYIAFSDRRGPGGEFASIQRLDPNGYTGDPRPAITAVDDIPNDDGGVLLVDWTASDRDNYDEQLIDEYLVLRRFASASAKPADATALASATGLSPGVAESYATVGWEYVSTVEALRLPAYATSAPSYADQTQSTTPVTEYMVIARAIEENALFESLPLGGTSVDNLAPAAPTNLQALRNGLDADLSWAAPVQPIDDIAEYRIYRGATSNFTVSPSSLVGTSTQLMWTEIDAGTVGWFYRVTAVDIHDNEGPASDPAPLDALTAIDGRAVSLKTRIDRVQPNPFNPSTEIHFELAQPGRVEVGVFDLRGRRVAQLFEGSMPSGAHSLRWSGEGDQGEAVSSGTYFVRLITKDGSDVVKIVLAK